ncbi:MAG: hypothetical protein GX793_02590 [Bacteroidales bacterium]|jgi:hypothetical protein|nr:hypothetical protein [Bacteroidales bacterium]MCK9499540.1 hypothetical protein [Bacteroidales bacterium]NLB85929.1 hypothetical protein [Bacteroidales bacterium]
MKKIILVSIVIGLYNIAFTQTLPPENIVKRVFENGTVLSSPVSTYKGHNFDVSLSEYDPFLLGVYYNENPEWDPKNPARTYKNPVVITGITYVRFTENNGQIKKGDPVTSSNIAGLAMKATEPGIILGVALEDAGESGDLLKIRVFIQYVR